MKHKPTAKASVWLCAPVNVSVLAEHAGAFRNGYTDADVAAVFEAVHEATGVHFAALWEVASVEGGFDGNSSFVVVLEGQLYEFREAGEDDRSLVSFLAGDGDCPTELRIELCDKVAAAPTFNFAAARGAQR